MLASLIRHDTQVRRIRLSSSSLRHAARSVIVQRSSAVPRLVNLGMRAGSNGMSHLCNHVCMAAGPLRSWASAQSLSFLIQGPGCSRLASRIHTLQQGELGVEREQWHSMREALLALPRRPAL